MGVPNFIHYVFIDKRYVSYHGGRRANCITEAAIDRVAPGNLVQADRDQVLEHGELNYRCVKSFVIGIVREQYQTPCDPRISHKLDH